MGVVGGRRLVVVALVVVRAAVPISAARETGLRVRVLLLSSTFEPMELDSRRVTTSTDYFVRPYDRTFVVTIGSCLDIF